MIYYIGKITSWLHRNDINAFHFALFHGAVSRNGQDASSRPWPKPGQAGIAQLHLVRGCDYPAVTSDSGRLLVNETVAKLISTQLALQMVEVSLRKVINIPLVHVNYQMNRLLDKYARNPRAILDGEPNDESSRTRLGKYFELIAFVESDLPQAGDKRLFDCGFDRFSTPIASIISREILDELHLVLYGGCFVSERLFQILQPHLNLDYFFVRSFPG